MDESGQVLAQPGHGRELDRVGDLVQRHPAQELVGICGQLPGGVVQVGPHEQEPGGRVRVEDDHVVLAQDPARDVAEQHANLGGEHGPGAHADRGRQRARSLAHLRHQRLQEGGHRTEVGVDPLVAGQELGGRERGRGMELGVGGHQPLGLGHDLGQLGPRPPRRGLPGDGGGDAAGERPVDHPDHHGNPASPARITPAAAR